MCQKVESNLKFFLFSVLFSLFTLVPIFSEQVQTFYVSWDSILGAGGYRVEIKDSSDQIILSKNVAGNVLSIKLPQDSYYYRIITLNRFMKPDGMTAWAPCETEPPKAPEFTSLAPSIIQDNKSIEVLLIADFNSKKAQLSLINVNNKSMTVPITSLGSNQWKVSIPSLKEGLYKLQLQNGKGLITTIDQGLTVQAEPEKAQIPKFSFIIPGQNFSSEPQVILKSQTSNTTLKPDKAILGPQGLEITILQELLPGIYEVDLDGITNNNLKKLGSLRVTEKLEVNFEPYQEPLPPKPEPIKAPEKIFETNYPYELGLGWTASKLLRNPWGSIYTKYKLAEGEGRFNFYLTPHRLKQAWALDFSLEDLAYFSFDQSSGNTDYQSSKLFQFRDQAGPGLELSYGNFYTDLSLLAGLTYAKCKTTSAANSTLDFTAETQISAGWRVGCFSIEADFGYTLVTMTKVYDEISTGIRLNYFFPVTVEVLK